jgi:polyisoprenyl-teichoic acid--peptidoglycan teichoic acid transferase
MLLGCVIVLLCSAGATAVAVLEEVHTLSQDLSQNGSLNVGAGSLASAGWGSPQTLLLVGDDQRLVTQYYHRAVPHLANEMLLVRLDPSKPYISMMSIPRELWVPIHPPGRLPYVNRLNSAYTYGVGTLVSTIKQVLGLSVNHVVVVTFPHFKRAVDAMGCVYSTVDRRYFHVNVAGGDQYQEINLQPGYQKLCGTDALQFVSYRHGDTSQVRDARDQSFLMDVKKQYGPTLVSNAHKFEQIMGQAVQTDPGLHSPAEILNLLGTLISSSGRRVRQVHFQANLLATYDTASPQQIGASVHAFLFGGSSAVPRSSTAAVAHSVHSHKGAAHLPLVPTTSSDLGQAHGAAAKLAFPLEYPRVKDANGSVIAPTLRSYTIHAPDGTGYPAYDAVFDAGSLGQFYDVQGMSWTTAPQFDSPEQTVRVAGRSYYLYYEGSNLKMVAWYQHGAVYWIRNSLTDAVGNGEMLAIAEQTEPFTTLGPGRARVVLKAAGVPGPPKIQPKTSVRETIGSIGGLMTLLALPLLAFLGIRRIRELRRPRAELVSGQQIGARLPVLAGAAGAGAIAGRPRVGRGPVTRPTGPAARAASRAANAAASGASIAGPASGMGERWSGAPKTYRRRAPLRRPAVIVGLVVVIAAAAAAAVLLAGHGRQTAITPAARKAAAAHRAATIPTVPVVVLNATTTAGAAGTLATQLRADKVAVSQVGNVTETRPPGTEVLYAPGQRAQATLVARLLSARQPTLSPIDPVTAAAAGGGAPVVVLIS